MKYVPWNETKEMKNVLHGHFTSLSQDSSEMRFFNAKSAEAIQHWLNELCNQTHYEHHWLMQMNDEGHIVCLGQISIDKKNVAEIALSVLDDYQGQGWGKKMMSALIEHCAQLNCKEIYVSCLPKNRTVQAVLKQHGFDLTYIPGEHFYGCKVL